MAKEEYNQLMEEGPFPNQIDPWAEKGEYFHPIHGQMISIFLQVLREPLRDLGYRIGREPSMQIASNLSSLPDIFLETNLKTSKKDLDYHQAVVSADLDFGIVFEKDVFDLDRLFIRSLDSNELVTIVELISPNNKTKLAEIEYYQLRREITIAHGIHCVEIDLTRSVRHLVTKQLNYDYDFPYHTAVHLNDGELYFIGTNISEAIKTFALPLRSEIIPVELGKIYRQAYIETGMAEQLLQRTAYNVSNLPFPSLLKEQEHKMLLQQVEAWKAALEEAKK